MFCQLQEHSYNTTNFMEKNAYEFLGKTEDSI